MGNDIEPVLVPDIGGATDVTVIEVFVKPGDAIAKEAPLITLESAKASMDVPSPVAGLVKEVQVKVGDKVAEGSPIVTVVISAEAQPKTQPTEKKPEETQPVTEAVLPEKRVKTSEVVVEKSSEILHAGPWVRRLARELGIDLTRVPATGPKGRLQKEDLQQFIQARLRASESPAMALAPAPRIDFSQFGAIEKTSLSKIKKLSGANLSRNWMTIPHVTQWGEADITEMEAFRQSQKEIVAKKGIRLTLLVFLMKAVVVALKEFPQFNASLEVNGQELILKKYFHIGVAVDTPNGLVVPVIRDVDRKGIFELAQELGDISEKAREKGLGLADMQGGCFTISSLGGIGGSGFTPIINAPEVAILGVSRMQWKSVCRTEKECRTRLMLPLSLSYDHRVIDGADGARLMVSLENHLADIRTLLL